MHRELHLWQSPASLAIHAVSLQCQQNLYHANFRTCSTRCRCQEFCWPASLLAREAHNNVSSPCLFTDPCPHICYIHCIYTVTQCLRNRVGVISCTVKFQPHHAHVCGACMYACLMDPSRKSEQERERERESVYKELQVCSFAN